MNIYRHGDVLIKQIASLPKGVKPLDTPVKNEFILAYGEITGHKHVLAVAEKTDEPVLTVYEHEGKTYLEVQKSALVQKYLVKWRTS